MTAQINDLRGFLNLLEAESQVTHINKEVDREYELGSVVAAFEKKENKATYFHHVKNSTIPVCANLLGSVERIAMALGIENEEIQGVIGEALKHPVEPILVDDGVCQEVVLDKDIDLSVLPIPTHAPDDAGAYITSGLVFSKSIKGGHQNVSYHRMEIKGPNKVGIFINEWRHLATLYNEAESLGEALPIAVVIGCDPVHYITAGLRTDLDEVHVSGALRQQPTEVVLCMHSDILVPASSEIVLEGKIWPERREKEGPLGEFTGHYSKTWMNPVVEIETITHRKDPIYQTINSASKEHVLLGNVIPREPVLFDFVSYVSKGVKDVHIPPYGSGFMAIIKVKKSNPGEPKNLALAAMTSNVNIKNVVVVDEDVDIYDSEDVLWAISNRVNPLTDVFSVPHSQCHELDPTSDVRGVGTKLGIDATLKEGNKNAKRVLYPSIQINDYLD